MIIKTFTAETVAAALKDVRTELGGEALFFSVVAGLGGHPMAQVLDGAYYNNVVLGISHYL